MTELDEEGPDPETEPVCLKRGSQPFRGDEAEIHQKQHQGTWDTEFRAHPLRVLELRLAHRGVPQQQHRELAPRIDCRRQLRRSATLRPRACPLLAVHACRTLPSHPRAAPAPPAIHRGKDTSKKEDRTLVEIGLSPAGLETATRAQVC